MNQTSTQPLPPLLVAGTGPLPPEKPGKLFAPGLRVWGIARELAAQGNPVRLATVHFTGEPLCQVFVRDLEIGEAADTLPTARVVELGEGAVASVLEREAKEFGAVAAIGSCELMNRELAVMGGDLPLWCDFFGDPMAERQMISRLLDSDALLADQWRTYAPILARADRCSGCSRYQAAALLGQLGAMGRLNRHTAFESIVHVIPPWLEAVAEKPESNGEKLLRGVKVPLDAKIIVQTGGFNTWLDVDTLFVALESTMQERAEVHFAATGGAIPGHNDRTFEDFQSRVEGSSFRNRFHLLGWVPMDHVPQVIAEADVAVNVDLPCAEGWLGTRNRLMDWIDASVPVVSTIGCELVQDFASRALIYGVPPSDPAAISAALLEVLDVRESQNSEIENRTREAREYLLGNHGALTCLAPLLDWAKDPRSASDLQAWRGTGESPPSLFVEASDRLRRFSSSIEGAERHSGGVSVNLAAGFGSRLARGARRIQALLRSG